MRGASIALAATLGVVLFAGCLADDQHYVSAADLPVGWHFDGQPVHEDLRSADPQGEAPFVAGDYANATGPDGRHMSVGHFEMRTQLLADKFVEQGRPECGGTQFEVILQKDVHVVLIAWPEGYAPDATARAAAHLVADHLAKRMGMTDAC